MGAAIDPPLRFTEVFFLSWPRRMSVPAYELMFGKLPLRSLFEDYFDNAGTISSRIMLKPLEDPHVDLVANVSFET